MLGDEQLRDLWFPAKSEPKTRPQAVRNSVRVEALENNKFRRSMLVLVGRRYYSLQGTGDSGRSATAAMLRMAEDWYATLDVSL